jgi:hypothetical protein
MITRVRNRTGGIAAIAARKREAESLEMAIEVNRRYLSN